jgi:hypothetical protein
MVGLLVTEDAFEVRIITTSAHAMDSRVMMKKIPAPLDCCCDLVVSTAGAVVI